MNRVMQGRPAGSYIASVGPSPADRPGQNDAEYRRAVEAMEGRTDVAAFIARVEAIGHASAFVCVNPCARYWIPGTPADVTLCFQLRREDGSNLLSYAGGGRDVEDALTKATASLDRFVSEAVAGR